MTSSPGVELVGGREGFLGVHDLPVVVVVRPALVSPRNLLDKINEDFHSLTSWGLSERRVPFKSTDSSKFEKPRDAPTLPMNVLSNGSERVPSTYRTKILLYTGVFLQSDDPKETSRTLPPVPSVDRPSVRFVFPPSVDTVHTNFK